jgi:hypothetical protein
MSPIKDITLQKLFMRVYNKLLTNQSILTNFAATLRLVNDVKIGGGQLKQINEELDGLMKQEHVLLKLYEKGVTDKALLRIEHEALIGKITSLRAERNALIEEIEGEDNRLRATDQLIGIFSSAKGPLELFDESLFEEIVDKLIVKERECIVFCLKNGMELEERYEFLRGDDRV